MTTVLIVDDSETLRHALREDLEKAGYKVVEASNGKDGLSKLAANKDVNVIIADLNMPEMDGITMCSKLKEANTHPGIPIFMLTSEATPDLKARSKEAGVMAWVVKPHVSEKIIAAIKKVTRT
jgi:two-component system chemotaxis response regulator CheY